MAFLLYMRRFTHGLACGNFAQVFLKRLQALHGFVVRAVAAFGSDPVDVLGRVFDIAGFAVQAVLRMNVQARLPVFLRKLVHARRAVAGFGAGILRPVDAYRHAGITQHQVAGLIFRMVGIA